MEYIRQMQEADLNIMSEFMVMAATLLDIKCKMLLPKEVNEEGEEEDPREELVQQLLEYKMYKYMSYELRDRMAEASRCVYKPSTMPEEVLEYRPPVNVEELTAITTSLSVATTLAENDECTVIQLGGVLRNSSFSVVGPFAEQMLRQFSCSKLFFGVDGFDLNYGVTTTNLMGGHLALMMIETVQKVIALVDSSKFGRRGFCKMCDVDRIDMVITDDGVSPIVVEQLQEAGIDVRIVEVIRTTVP